MDVHFQPPGGQKVYSGYYPLMPETVASHFDGAGRPNGWSYKQSFFALYLMMMGIMSLVFFGLPRLLRHFSPSLINIPNRKYWLTPERKQEALAMLDEEMGWFGIATMVLMASTIQLAIDANVTGGGSLRSGAMWMLFGGFAAFTGIWLVKLYRRFRIPS